PIYTLSLHDALPIFLTARQSKQIALFEWIYQYHRVQLTFCYWTDEKFCKRHRWSNTSTHSSLNHPIPTKLMDLIYYILSLRMKCLLSTIFIMFLYTDIIDRQLM